MAIRYKIDVIATLKEKGITSYKIRAERLLSESTLQNLRKGQSVSWPNLSTLCELLECQVGDLLEYVPDEAVQ